MTSGPFHTPEKQPEQKETLKQRLGIYARGLAMGAADVVPGVSGGTIALITGIYDRFIDSLKNIGSIQTFHELRRGQLRKFFIRSDFIFLITLFAGILTSIIGLSKIITELMVSHPQPLWSFFMGLVLASAVIMLRDMFQAHGLTWRAMIALAIGGIIAIAIGRMAPQDFDVQHWHLFAGGAIAICAMILPGISGSFLLLMMGLYGVVLNAVQEFNVPYLFLFVSGCAVGILSFSHLLSWCLHRFPTASFGFLIGLMIGSVEKIWPWKEAITTRVKSSGEVVPLLERAVSPLQFEQITGVDAHLGLSIAAFSIGFLCILVVGWRNTQEK